MLGLAVLAAVSLSRPIPRETCVLCLSLLAPGGGHGGAHGGATVCFVDSLGYERDGGMPLP